MNRFQRYVFAQVLAAVGLAVGLFVFVMMTGTLLKEVLPYLSNGIIGWGQFFELLLLAIPSVLPYALPIGILTGVLIVLGRMSAQNEILAMKSSGLSLWRIISPVFLLAAAGVVLSAYINFYQAPRAVDSLKRILATAARTDPSRLIAPGEFTRFERYAVFAHERAGENELRNLTVWQYNERGQAFRIVHAKSATLTFDTERDLLSLIARDTRVEERNRTAPDNPTEPARVFHCASLPVELPLDALLKNMGSYRKKLRYCTLAELLKLREQGRDPRDNPAAPPPEDPAKRTANRIAAQLQIQSNLASAFGILSLTMLAVPLGIKTSRSETLANVAIALALALTFYVMTVAVSWIRDPALRPDLLVWLPNFLFQTVGGLLLFRASKT